MPEREVELADYLQVFQRWKWLILFVTLGCLGLAGFLAARLPRVYQLIAVVDIGDVVDDRTVDRLVARLSRAGAFEGLTDLRGRVVSVAEFRRPVFLDLRMETETPAEAVEVLQRTTDRVVAELNEPFRRQTAEVEARVAELQLRAEQIERDRLILERRAAEVRKSLDRLYKIRADVARQGGDAAAGFLAARVTDEIVAKENLLFDVDRRLNREMPRMADEVARATRVAQLVAERRLARLVNTPATSGVLIRPRVSPMLAAGLVGGLVVSALLAFVLDAVWSRARG
jgi:uncharacterized protein involved in exopolysaccharide biosynthesis